MIPRIVELLPKQLGIRFVIAGAVDNAVYLSMLQHACEGMPVRIEQNVDDARKTQLSRESHAFFSPSDNYQETFGVTILEAKHHGCVPVIADLNGYRHLVEDGQDGFLLRTWGAPVPDTLWRAQILMPDPVYHGWWAAGVCIDPGEAKY